MMKYFFSIILISVGLYAVNKYYPFLWLQSGASETSARTSSHIPHNHVLTISQTSKALTINEIVEGVKPWIFTDKQGNQIICEWCDGSSLERVRSVYIAGFLGHDFLEIRDSQKEKIAIDAVWSHRIEEYMPKLNKQPPEAFFAIGKKDSEIVGFIIFEERKPGEMYVTPLVIHPSIQKSGLGKELIFSILKRRPDLQKISLITMRSNSNAIAFYKHIGFKEFSDDEDHGYKPEELVAFELIF